MCSNLLLLTVTFITVAVISAAELKMKEELQAMAEQIEVLKEVHMTDVNRLRREVEQLKRSRDETPPASSNRQRNEQQTVEWAAASMRELRLEMRDMSRNVNSSSLLRQLHLIRNQLKQALTENTDLVQLSRTQEARIDKLDSEFGRVKYENQQMRTMIADLRSQIAGLANEMKSKQSNEVWPEEPLDSAEARGGGHSYRHNKMVHAQISRLARAQQQLDGAQQRLQTQLLDAQRRLDRCEESNWPLLADKLHFLEQDTKLMHDQITNTSRQVADLDKLHASLLELREDIESIENKADNTIPEIRKEISKLDISFAQMNAQSSYLKEDQETLRQSVKAIAVSVSNAIDKAELDHTLLKTINDSVYQLHAHSREHFSRLNHHILKSEANSFRVNETVGEASLEAVMSELQQLRPARREYERLVRQLPRSCAAMPDEPAGVYAIRPGRAPLDAWCDRGATLLQRRLNGSVEFNRRFSEYVRGFGAPAGEHWLGLDAMHHLTADNCSSMRIDMTDIYGGRWYAEYEQFRVGPATGGYVLEVAGFKGNASDAFQYQNHMEFSAIDRDRDISNTHCAANYEGGWWFSHCQHVNINGKYTLGLTWFDSARNQWIAVASTEMRIYHRQNCPP